MTKTIVNRRKHILRTENGVVLRPGKNNLGPEKLLALSKSSAAKTWRSLLWIMVEKGAPATLEQEIASDEVEPDDGDGDGAKRMSAKDAIDFVAACDDVEALQAMLEVEHRVTVAAAVQQRIEALAADEGAGGEG